MASKPELLGIFIRSPTKWFRSAAKDDLTVAATPGVFDSAAAGLFGRVAIDGPVLLKNAHAHVDAPHGSGTSRSRSGGTADRPTGHQAAWGR